jgi:hypothetical protein
MTVDDGAWQPVAVYPPAAGSGGEATVFVSRAPAMFYRITCPALGVDLSTGSGAHDLADGIAAALAAGMLGPTSKED